MQWYVRFAPLCLAPMYVWSQPQTVPEWTSGEQWYPPSFVAAEQDKSRKKWTAQSPLFLNAVAKLDGALSRCSGTLITAAGALRRDILLTAAHCIPKDPSTLVATWFKPDGQKSTHAVAQLIASGQLPAGDWALLRLKEPVLSEVTTPLLPYQGGPLHDARFMLAGYSADRTTLLGNAGRDLTYDPSCVHDEPAHTKIWYRAQRCYAYPGASGGAYIAWWAQTGEARILGPLSSIRPGVNYVVKHSEWVPELESYISLSN